MERMSFRNIITPTQQYTNLDNFQTSDLELDHIKIVYHFPVE